MTDRDEVNVTPIATKLLHLGILLRQKQSTVQDQEFWTSYERCQDQQLF
jgi:hypothetical protein